MIIHVYIHNTWHVCIYNQSIFSLTWFNLQRYLGSDFLQIPCRLYFCHHLIQKDRRFHFVSIIFYWDWRFIEKGVNLWNPVPVQSIIILYFLLNYCKSIKCNILTHSSKKASIALFTWWTVLTLDLSNRVCVSSCDSIVSQDWVLVYHSIAWRLVISRVLSSVLKAKHLFVL